jgi:hypothetical protein
MAQINKSNKNLFLVWGLYAPFFNCIFFIGSIAIITGFDIVSDPQELARFTPTSILEFLHMISLYGLIVLPPTLLLIAVVSFVPSMVVGLIQRAVSARLRDDRVTTALVCVAGAIAALPYGMILKGLTFSGQSWFWLPLSSFIGVLTCYSAVHVQRRMIEN